MSRIYPRTHETWTFNRTPSVRCRILGIERLEKDEKLVVRYAFERGSLVYRLDMRKFCLVFRKQRERARGKPAPSWPRERSAQTGKTSPEVFGKKPPPTSKPEQACNDNFK